MDNDGDGFISVPEIVDFLTNFGDKMSADEVNSLIGSVARDNRGFVHCKGKDKIDSKIDTGCPSQLVALMVISLIDFTFFQICAML